MSDYGDRGIRALVILHDQEMRAFLKTWTAARAAGVSTPKVEDPAYESMERLLSHVLGAGRGYMTWLCELLELPDPEIDPAPELDEIEARAEAYVEHLLARWDVALRGAPEGAPDKVSGISRWGVSYSVDAMLEHAVMHPRRHAFQIEEWMRG